MKFIISIYFIALSFNSFCQHMITDSTFYGDGKLKSFGRYDSVHKYWILHQLYETGQIERTRILDAFRYCDTDTSFVYHRNGKIAWIFPYNDSGSLTGKLIGYYPDGSIKREANYYRHFRVGTWKDYYENGKVKSISYYQISSEDSVFNGKLLSNYHENGIADEEYFTWGEREPNDTIFYNGVKYGGRTQLTTTTLISKKIGKWKTYDSSGKRRDKRLTDFENTVMVKNLMGKNELSLEKVKEIYEKSNSLEELAKMFEENEEWASLLQEKTLTENIVKLLRSWHEASVDFLEMLNKPRLALGLDKLIFKEGSNEKALNP